jgi:hypothetical protein
MCQVEGGGTRLIILTTICWLYKEQLLPWIVMPFEIGWFYLQTCRSRLGINKTTLQLK